MTGANGQQVRQRPAVILLVNSLGVGGAERQTIALANLLGDRFQVILAYLKPDENLVEQIDRNRVAEVCSIDAKSRVDRQAARRLADLAARYDARLILCANGFALMYAQIACAMSAHRIVIVEVFHSTKLGTWKERLSMALYWPLFLAAHHLVFVCDGQRQHWDRFGLRARQTHRIYNGVDVDYFDPTRIEPAGKRWRESLGWKPTDRVVGICAALRPEKAHADLLRAVALLRDRGQTWKVLIIGDGPMRGAVEAETAALGLQQQVAITGFLSDVREPLAACDVVALVSKTEAFSIAALEAMAMGKPMIMSDVGGAREQVIDGVNGFVFPVGDVSLLAKCLGECGDPQRTATLGSAARDRVRQEFSQTSMLARYTELIESALTRGGPDQVGGDVQEPRARF